VANVDQLKLSPDSRWARANVVLLRPGYNWTQGRSDAPALLVLGYSNLPEDFDRQLPAFEKLVGHLELSESGPCFEAANPPRFWARCTG